MSRHPWPRNRILRITVALVGVLVAVYLVPERGTETWDGSAGAAALERALQEGASGLVTEFEATVERPLPDDLDGSRHQRFIVRLETGQTVLVSHNIDLAERVPIDVGTKVSVRGQYEWNDEGGVVHWTHHDPAGERPGGWIRLGAREYR